MNREQSAARGTWRRQERQVLAWRYAPKTSGGTRSRSPGSSTTTLDGSKASSAGFESTAARGKLWKAVLAGKTLRQIQPGDIERFVAQRLGGWQPATVNRSLAFLKRVFNVAIADGLVETNPARKVRLLKENNARVQFLSETEEERLMAELADADRVMVEVALHTGMRQGEQLHLRWDDVDFATGILTIPRSKSGEARRIPMNDTVRAILERLTENSQGAWVFPSTKSAAHLDRGNYMSRIFQPALQRAGIDNFRWHDLRHTFASRLVMAGVDIRTVQELMGHKTLVRRCATRTSPHGISSRPCSV